MTSEVIQHNLPVEPNDFIGRERDLAELRQLLVATRAVTLCGSGGIGKTRLALRVATTLVEEFPDGVWFVELADVIPEAQNGPVSADDGFAQPDLVIRRVAAAVGVAEEAGHTLVETLTDALRPRRLLIVLDNCEHVIAISARLCQTMLAGCPELHILATSREPLRVPGETVWRVPPLTVPIADASSYDELARHEAVQLFVARAAASRPGIALTHENARPVAELCRALDGVPLAIELAAARVRVLSVEQVASRLHNRFRLLSEGDRTAPLRQRTLRAAIDWSYGLLSEPEQMLLRRLSVFAGWTLDQAEQVCAELRAFGGSDDLPAEDVLDVLTALVDKSLVVVDREVAGQMRFRLLDSIREYARERLADAGEETDLRSLHRDHMVETCEYDGEIAMAERKASWAARVELFRKYDSEQDNIRAALAWSLERGDIEEGLRICTAGRSYWIARGYFTELGDWTDRFLARGPGEVPARVWGAALVGRAQLAIDQRDFDRAETAAAEGLELCRAAGDDVMVAAALEILAQMSMRAGRPDEAAARLDEAIATAKAGGDRWNESLALITQGFFLARQNRLREAQHSYEAGLAAMREIDQQWGAARALIGLGQLAQRRGDLSAARSLYEEALPVLREIQALPEIARSQAGIGRVALEQGDLELAREMFRESLTLSRSTGIRLAVARGLEAVAALTSREGDPRRAVQLAGAAAALRETIGQPPPSGARIEQVLAPARKHLGEPAVAQLWAQGRSMPTDEAIALALEHPETTAPITEPGSDGPIPAPRPGMDAARTSEPAPVSRAAVSPVTPPSTLTPREREIAVLVARGLSNRGIADELVISPATVARHVTNILTKLGFTSRAQIAVWAVDNESLGGDAP